MHVETEQMPVPREGDTLCPTGAVVLRGRRGVLNRKGLRCTWAEGLCTWCGQTVPPGRRTLWCSQWCVDAYSATQPQTQIATVKKRDGGRCALCGVDTVRLRNAALLYRDLHRARRQHDVGTRLAALLTRIGKPSDSSTVAYLMSTRIRWWDMDHTTPIADGGHPYALTNLRTLCYWCHKDETGTAATRRAEARRGVKAEPEAAQVPLF